MRVLVCVALLTGCAEPQPAAIPSHLSGEAADGVRTAIVISETPFRAPGGEIVCGPEGAIGYRAPAGMIFALNGEGERLAQTEPTNRAWSPLEYGLRPDASRDDVERMRTLGVTTC